MTVTLHGVHYTLTPGIRRFAMEHLYEPIRRTWDREAASLDVFLADLHGTKRGEDQACRCVLRVPHGPQIVITEQTDDMRTSIHQARKRLANRLRNYRENKLAAPKRLRQRSRLDPNRFGET